jgi:hypothetical protein
VISLLLAWLQGKCLRRLTVQYGASVTLYLLAFLLTMMVKVWIGLMPIENPKSDLEIAPCRPATFDMLSHLSCGSQVLRLHHYVAGVIKE